MCQGLSYNLTSFPNIWLSIVDQREAANVLHQYNVRDSSTQNPACLMDRICIKISISASLSLSRFWWSWIVLIFCVSWCVRCSYRSAAHRVVCCSRAARCAQQQSSIVHMICSSSASPGPLTVTCYLTHTTPHSAQCHNIQHCLHRLDPNYNSTLWKFCFRDEWVFFGLCKSCFWVLIQAHFISAPKLSFFLPYPYNIFCIS